MRLLSVSALVLALAAAGLPPTAARAEPAAAEPQADARAMYDRGAAKFSTADYRGAIETWTELLSTLPEGGEYDGIRLDLFFNIAVAHEREYSLDNDPRHLRQALTLFKTFASVRNDGSADENIARIEAKLEELESDGRGGEPPPPTAGAQEPPPATQPTVDAGPASGRLRGVGIGLVAAGGAFVVGGVVLVVLGSRFKPAAEDQLAELDDANVPDDSPLRVTAVEFVDSETAKGIGLMAGGGALLGVGVVGIGVGIWALVRAKKKRSQTANLSVWPIRGGAAIAGRF